MGVPLERFWKTINPITRPLASAPLEGSTMSLLSVYGDAAAFVNNIRANPRVRVKRRGRWLDGTAEVVEASPEAVVQLGVYARLVLIRMGSDPKVVRMTID